MSSPITLGNLCFWQWIPLQKDSKDRIFRNPIEYIFMQISLRPHTQMSFFVNLKLDNLLALYIKGTFAGRNHKFELKIKSPIHQSSFGLTICAASNLCTLLCEITMWRSQTLLMSHSELVVVLDTFLICCYQPALGLEGRPGTGQGWYGGGGGWGLGWGHTGNGRSRQPPSDTQTRGSATRYCQGGGKPRGLLVDLNPNGASP